MGGFTVRSTPRSSTSEAIRCCVTCSATYLSDFPRCPLDGGELRIAAIDPLLGSTINKHYVVDALIGQGAMGRVYRAHHSRLVRKRYALKVLLGDLAASATMRMRFAHEAEIASRLDHPNIVGVLDFGCTPTGLLYLVMELVEGRGLDCVLRDGPMSPARVVRLARQLCGGLAHAHAQGVVHRDLKPENILVIASGAAETVRIADLGLAISMSADAARLTASGVVCTPSYAAPEQLLGTAIDHRVDLYALGTTMFEMLTGGTLPFEGDAQGVMSQKLGRDAPSITQLVPHVPAPLAALIDTLLERRARHRPASAEVVIGLLDQLASAPTRRRRSTARMRGRTTAVRPRWHGVPAAVLAGGLAAVGWHQAPRVEPSAIRSDVGVETFEDAPRAAASLTAPPMPAQLTVAAPQPLGAHVIDDALSLAVVRRAIGRVFPLLSGCAALVGHRDVSIRIAIEAAGRATGVEVNGAGVGCIIGALATMLTERGPDDGEAKVDLDVAVGTLR